MTIDPRFVWAPDQIRLVGAETVAKHTPGGQGHDQDKHGDRGGTLASSPTYDSAARRAADDFIDRGDNIPAQSGLDYSSARLTNIRSAAKAKIVADVGARLAASEAFRANYDDVSDHASPRRKEWLAQDADETVNGALRQWSESASDDDPRALAMQIAAAEEFDLPSQSVAQMQRGVGTYTLAAARAKLDNASRRQPSSRGMLRPMLRAMYEHTQEELTKVGIERVTLFRGMRPVGGETEYWPDLGEQEFMQNPISSWTSSPGVASEFAGPNGAVLTATFPRARILGTARTGFGSLPEFEFTVLAGEGKVLVESNEERNRPLSAFPPGVTESDNG